MGVNASLQDFRMERFRHEVISAGLVPLERGLILATRGEKNDGDVPEGRIALDRSAEVKPTCPRHHYVGQHEVGPILFQELQGLGTVRRRIDDVRLLQHPRDEAAKVVFVLGNQEPGYAPPIEQQSLGRPLALPKLGRGIFQVEWFLDRESIFKAARWMDVYLSLTALDDFFVEMILSTREK